MNKIVLLFLIVFLFSCSDKSKNVVYFRENVEKISFKKELLILDVPDDLVLGTIIQIEFNKDNIYVLTLSGSSSSLNVFDKSGKYLGKIGDNGRADGEYIIPMSFFFYKDKICVVDGDKYSVLFYNKTTFEYIGEKKMNLDLISFGVVNDDLLVSYCKINDSYFKYFNGKFDVGKGYLKPDVVSGYTTGSLYPMCKVGDELRVYTPYSTTIYDATENGVFPKYSLELSDFKMPEKGFLSKISKSNNFFEELETSKFISYFSYFETEKAMAVGFIVGNEIYLAYYGKGDNNGVIFSKENMKSEFGVFTELIGVYGDYFVMPVENIDLPNGYSENDIPLLLFK